MKSLSKSRNNKKLSPRSRLLRERANMSFFIVIMFFAVFGVIVLTEIFLIDERGRGQGVIVAHGSHGGVRQRSGVDRPDYEDQALLQGDDYLVYKGAGFDDQLGVFIREDRHAASPVRPQANGGIKQAVKRPVLGPAEPRLPQVATNMTARDGVWQTVSGTRYKFFVFSAYYDGREERYVRVIGATKTRGHDPVWCRLWYSSNTSAAMRSISVAAKVKVIRENWNLKYSACFVLCPLKRNLTVPDSVSIVTRLRIAPANHIIVRNARRNVTSPVPDKMAVCVKPLHFQYNQALQMLEFIELNRMLGVDHLTLYNHTLGAEVSCILHDYEARNVVTMLPWQLKMVSQKEIRTEGLFAALNDCLYRNMYRYKHVALIDLDEYIVPRHNDTLPQLIRWMGQRMNTATTGSYSFQNAFFYLQWPDDESLTFDDPLEAGLVTLRKTRRRTKLHPHKQRSKYICRPDFVVEAGNHFVWEFVPGHGTLNIPPDAAILHHYRVCEFGGDDCVKSQSLVDRKTYKYRAHLVERVRTRWKELQVQCDLHEPTRVTTQAQQQVQHGNHTVKAHNSHLHVKKNS